MAQRDSSVDAFRAESVMVPADSDKKQQKYSREEIQSIRAYYVIDFVYSVWGSLLLIFKVRSGTKLRHDLFLSCEDTYQIDDLTCSVHALSFSHGVEGM